MSAQVRQGAGESADAPSVRPRTGSDALAQVLAEAGVSHVFGIPGEHCLGIVDAIDRRGDLQFVSVRHESAAALMAEAYGKYTGTPGVCVGTASVGAANLVAGVNVAHHDSTPMLAIAGQVTSEWRGRDAWQEIDLVSMFEPLCRFGAEVTRTDRLPEVTLRALSLARSRRPGPTFLSVPIDVQDAPGQDVPPGVPEPSRPAVGDEELAEVAELIRSARRPLLVVGGGIRAAGARDDLVRLAEQVRIPVVTAFRRTDAFPNDSEYYVGALGLSATDEVRNTVLAADLLLVVGTRLSEVTTLRYAFPTAEQRTVHIDVDSGTLATQWAPARTRLTGDARHAVRGLARHCRSAGVDKDDVWWSSFRVSRTARLEAATEDPSAPLVERVAARIDRLLPADGVVTSDAGDFFLGCAPLLEFAGNRRYLGPTSGTMGYGLPAAVAAKLADPERVCVALVGDGGLMMSIQELETAVRYGAGVVVVVFDNHAYGSIVRHQTKQFDGRLVGTRLGNPPFARLAELFGATGYKVTDAAEFDSAFRRAIGSNEVSLIEVSV